MKVLLLLLLAIVVAATALPVLKDDEAVKIIMKGLNEGQILDNGDVVDIIKLKENTTVSTATDETEIQPVMLSESVTPEVVVMSHLTAQQASLHQLVVLPSAAVPEVVSFNTVFPHYFAHEGILPEPIAHSQSEPFNVISEEVVQPAPAAAAPNVVEALPFPAAQNGEFNNDSGMSESVPEEAGVFNTLQSWFNVFMNYFSGDSADDQSYNPSEKMW